MLVRTYCSRLSSEASVEARHGGVPVAVQLEQLAVTHCDCAITPRGRETRGPKSLFQELGKPSPRLVRCPYSAGLGPGLG